MPREIVVQADVGGITIAFTDPVDSYDDTTDEILDRRLKSIGRQKAKLDLAEKLLAMQAREMMMAQLPDQEARVLKNRAAARIAMREGWRAEDEARPGPRRREFREGPTHLKNLAEFDQETERVKANFEGKRKELEDDGPQIEAQISRLRAVIAGRDPTEYVGENVALEAAE